jgi:hypothetical protein
MDIGGCSRLNEESKEISNDLAILPDDESGIPELVKKHRMMKMKGPVASPEVCDFQKDLVEIRL